MLLGDGFFHASGILIPSRTFELESKDERTVFKSSKHLSHLGIPVHLLHDVSLNVKLVKTLACLLSADLLDGSQERVWLVKSVQETDGLLDHCGVIFPQVEHFKTLSHVVQPRRETSGSHPRLFGPFSTNLVQRDVFHKVFHGCSHGEFSFECEVKILEINDNLVDKGVNQLTFLQVDSLIRSTSVIL